MTNNSYKDILEKREVLNNKFINENQKLKLKKERLFLNKDINKFEIDKKVEFNHQRLLKDKNYAFRMKMKLIILWKCIKFWVMEIKWP